MKFVIKILKIVVPLIALFVLLKTNVWLGIAAIITFAAWLIIRNLTAIYAYLGNVNYQKGLQNEAMKWLNKAVSRQDCKASYLIGYAFLHLKRGNLEQAEELLERARGLRPNREELMGLESNTALLLWKMNRLEEATAKMEGLYVDFKNTNIYGTLGYFYILSGDLDKALAFNKEAYEFNESGAVIIDNLGQTYYLRGEYDLALKHYEELSSKNPTFPEAYFNYGLVLEAMGSREKALERMKKSLDYPISLLSTVTRDEIEAKISELEPRQPVDVTL